MKDKLVIIPCGKKKIWDDGISKGPVRAADAYTGTMFKLGVQYADAIEADWVILSAKYGYILPDDEIESYDVTFKKKSSNPISHKELYDQVLHLNILDYNQVIGLGGVEYRKAIEGSFCTYKGNLSFPFSGLTMGNYLHELKAKTQIEVNNTDYCSYELHESKHFEIDENGKITFLWRYWKIPTIEGAFSGWLEGPPPTNEEKLKAHGRINLQRQDFLELGPKQGAWDQFKQVITLIGKKLLVQMSGDWFEDPYPMEAFCAGVHLDRDEEGFLRCYMCLKDIVHHDTGMNGADGMYDGSCHLVQGADGVSLLSLVDIRELSVVEQPK